MYDYAVSQDKLQVLRISQTDAACIPNYFFVIREGDANIDFKYFRTNIVNTDFDS